VSPDGVILTNAHVVRDADEVTVKLQDRREYRAKVLGSDPKTDVAVLKIDAKNLPVVPIGNSRNLQVGEWVLAIGSPYGLESSVTAGVVSAKGRSLPGDQVPFIQTDVAVNPGNSGGPLFNTRGEVVGINSQIYSQTGGYQGLSFAIPIDVAVRIKDQIVATGKVQHAKLGVTVQDVNQGFADSFKLESPEGALVSNVERGGAADKAGLKPGDVIRKINGQPIISSGDLPASCRSPSRARRWRWTSGATARPVQLNATLANANDKAGAVGVAATTWPASTRAPSWAWPCVRWTRWNAASPASPSRPADRGCGRPGPGGRRAAGRRAAVGERPRRSTASSRCATWSASPASRLPC
jgi:serine protease Do